jgi:hypothetical protein
MHLHFAFIDYHITLTVGRYGVTVGPHFLSIDKDGDIEHQVICTPPGYRAPLTEFMVEWSSETGLSYFIPEMKRQVPQDNVR